MSRALTAAFFAGAVSTLGIAIVLAFIVARYFIPPDVEWVTKADKCVTVQLPKPDMRPIARGYKL